MELVHKKTYYHIQREKIWNTGEEHFAGSEKIGNYSPVEGSIHIGASPLEQFDLVWWRTQCGAVMQDGFIFSESIARNIALSDEKIDVPKLHEAARIANIDDFVSNLPLAYNTVIGQEGQGISQGQRQRLLIARAIYKNPQFIFLDEATNALDANTEKIMEKEIVPENTAEIIEEEASCIGIEFDENGEPIGCYTPVEIFDELDRNFVATFGEEGRRRANARRERWNRRGTWHFNELRIKN
jgi:ABC-type proline/glycine betaine transport system ATPase subunit